MSEVAFGLLSNAYRIEGSRYVCPGIFDSGLPMPEGTCVNGWVSVKIGMALTAHKTAAMFMRYVHAEDDPGTGGGGEGRHPAPGDRRRHYRDAAVGGFSGHGRCRWKPDELGQLPPLPAP